MVFGGQWWGLKKNIHNLYLCQRLIHQNFIFQFLSKLLNFSHAKTTSYTIRSRLPAQQFHNNTK